MSLLVEPPEVLVEPALDLGPRRAVGVLGEELAGSLDQVGQRDVGQRLGADQVVDELAILGEPAGVQLLLERLGQLQGVGASGRVGELAEEAVDGGQRGGRVVDGGQRAGLALDLLPAPVVPDVLLRLLDLADRRGELRAPGPSGCRAGTGRSGAAVPLATWTPAALTSHSAFLLRAWRSSDGQKTPSDGCHSSRSAHRRAIAGAARSPLALEGQRAAESQGVVAGHGAERDQRTQPASRSSRPRRRRRAIALSRSRNS